jgi:hypothetical protein
MLRATEYLLADLLRLGPIVARNLLIFSGIRTLLTLSPSVFLLQQA